MATATSHDTANFTLEHLTPKIGAIIHGIDLRKPLAPEEREAVRQALLERKVVFFRDQDITTEQHLDFARNFGELEVHPFSPHKPDYPEVLAITHDRDKPGRENGWHSDVTWREQPSLGSVLRLLEVPSIGGDTLFADMESAYDDLTDEVKEKIDGKIAVHDFVLFRHRMKNSGASDEDIEKLNQKYPNVEHPVVRTHPETGRKSIYVNIGFTQHIIGMDKQESDTLLGFLYSRASIPEYQCRFKWEKNSMAFWDNRSCQHYAASDYWPERRVAERVTIIGDKPV